MRDEQICDVCGERTEEGCLGNLEAEAGTPGGVLRFCVSFSNIEGEKKHLCGRCAHQTILAYIVEVVLSSQAEPIATA